MVPQFLRISQNKVVNMNLVCMAYLDWPRNSADPTTERGVLLTFAAQDGDGSWEPEFYGDEARTIREYFDSRKQEFAR